MDNGFDQSSDGISGIVNSITSAVDGSGDVYVGGFFSSVNGSVSNHLVRLNNDGSVDSGFTPSFDGVNSYISSITPATGGSGDVYVGEDFDIVNNGASNHLVRLNSDGSVDSAFNLSGGGMNGAVNSIAPATDGSGNIYVGGVFTSVNHTTTGTLVRMGADGSVD